MNRINPAMLNRTRSQGGTTLTHRWRQMSSVIAGTTMNLEKRTLLQVRLEDAVESEEIFSTLMGEDVESRRKFIEDNALDVKNLDV
jgi:DNA gyrase/topoisomerase IV subunit B